MLCYCTWTTFLPRFSQTKQVSSQQSSGITTKTLGSLQKRVFLHYFFCNLLASTTISWNGILYLFIYLSYFSHPATYPLSQKPIHSTQVATHTHTKLLCARTASYIWFLLLSLFSWSSLHVKLLTNHIFNGNNFFTSYLILSSFNQTFLVWCKAVTDSFTHVDLSHII